MKRPRDSLSAAARRLDRRRRAVRSLTALLDGAAVAIGLSVVLVILVKLDVLSLPAEVVVPSSVAAAALLAAVFGALGKSQTLRELVRADRELDLKERLSTAYELRRVGPESLLTGLLLEDAEAAAPSVVATRVIPFRPGIRLPVIAGLLALLALFSLLNLGPGRASSEIREVAVELEELARRLISRAEREVLPETRRLAEEIRELGEKLASEAGDPEEVRRALSELAETARTQRRDLESEAREAITPPAGRTPSDSRLSRAEDEENAGAADADEPEEGSAGARQGGILGAETRTGRLAEAEALDAEDAESLAEAEQELLALASELETGVPGESERTTLRQSAGESGDTGAADDSGAAAPGGPEDGGETQSASEADDSDDAAAGGSGPPGSTAAPDEAGESERIYRLSEQPLSPLEGRVDPGESISSLVRSLPESAGGTLPESEVIAAYQRQMEESIDRARLPSGLRETVRSYFLLIGLADGG